jgi:ATP-dependent DNA helicase RecG
MHGPLPFFQSLGRRTRVEWRSGDLYSHVVPDAASKTILPDLQQPVSILWGVGKERSEQFLRMGIRTVEDLLLHRPRRHEDRRNLCAIESLALKVPAVARGKIVDLGVKWFAKRTRSIFEFVIEDGTGRLRCRWWNAPFMERNFAIGQEIVVYGKLQSLKPKVMEHPEVEAGDDDGDLSIHVNRIVPIHPLTDGMSQRWLRALVWHALERFQPACEREGAEADLRLTGSPISFLTRSRAIQFTHFPEMMEQIELARRRLALDEFLDLQKAIRERRARFETKSKTLAAAGDNRLIKPFLGKLGFKLTDSQTDVLRELRRDMAGRNPMRRLLQGDVGSGKTVVAACCALMAIESGYSVALMAPTEILAEQHYQTFQSWLSPLGIKMELLTGSRKGGSTPGTAGVLAGSFTSAHPSIVVGTHALIESGFVPEKLGLVIIDEQHRFGVAQREALVRKGDYPHLLVMTATPIPRTLGLTLYGDLDVSVIAKPPPGRGAIRTFVRATDKLPQVWDFIRAQLREGRQAYVVYPRVEEGDEKWLKAVTKEFGTLRQSLAPFQVGMIHGKLPSAEKGSVMTAFRSNRVQVLLATSLIEVGVDVPNATVMLIESAEQFGLAQLHQLRGRIGRGTHESYCILMAGKGTPEGRKRLKALEDTHDGFEIAEADLRLRGPGELLGQDQSGLPQFRFGDLQKDLELIKEAKRLVAALPEKSAAPAKAPSVPQTIAAGDAGPASFAQKAVAGPSSTL